MREIDRFKEKYYLSLNGMANSTLKGGQWVDLCKAKQCLSDALDELYGCLPEKPSNRLKDYENESVFSVAVGKILVRDEFHTNLRKLIEEK